MKQNKRFYSLIIYPLISLVFLFFTIPVLANKSRNTGLYSRASQLARSGNLHQAIKLWQQEVEIYKSSNDVYKEAYLSSEIARAYNKLGKFNLAINKLKYILSLQLKDSELNALIHSTIANSFQGKGDYERAIAAYEKSLKFDSSSLSSLNNLVKTYLLLLDKLESEKEVLVDKQSLEFTALQNNIYSEKDYSERTHTDSTRSNTLEKKIRSLKSRASIKADKALSLKASENPLSEIYALINWHKIASQRISKEKLAFGKKILEREAPSRVLVFTLINWSKVDTENNFYWLKEAKETALLLEDPLAESHVFLELGQHFYDADEFEIALEYTQQSQLIAQSNFMYENLYQAQWLLGKTYLSLNQRENSLTAYKNAISSLDIVNQNISSWDSIQQVKYRQNNKDLYHELIALLLDKNKVEDEDIESALFIADKLRFSELQSYFGDDCFEVRNQDSLKISQEKSRNEAVFYSLVMEDQTYIILKLPDGSRILSKIDMSRKEIQSLAVSWHRNLGLGNTNRHQIEGQQLYKLLISPFEQKLESLDLEVMIFVHDGILRNLPMSALYDGDRYLVEKWANVSSLGLNISTKEPPNNSEALIFGLSHPTQPEWSDLEMVENEVNQVHQLIGGKKYLNDDFTVGNLTNKLDKKFYSIVHLASHGYFAGNVEGSFLLAHDGQISISDLENILQNQTSINLLVLSACETAVTEDSALLGLAGVAARNGVKSILGSLWLVQDDLQSEAMREFYTYLADSKNDKAVALQKVQQNMISQHAHPQSWAALNLIGDYR